MKPAAYWIDAERVAPYLDWEPLLVILSFSATSWFIYKLLLRGVSPQRHNTLRTNFRNLASHIILGLVFFTLANMVAWLSKSAPWLTVLYGYIGFIAVIWGCIVFIKTFRIMAYEYLFLGSMKASVPLVLVNLLTLIASMFVLAWILTTFFQVQLAPLLATSAVFSIVLGLALQDTLGNLFAAIGLQLDKPFELGDWIEVRQNGKEVEKAAAGQVREISWRATVLLAITDELITIPNRLMAQAQISNFSGRMRPFIRTHVFRIRFDADIQFVKDILIGTALDVPEILKEPAPIVLIMDTTESWVTYKIVYYVHDYGNQFITGDIYLCRALDRLNRAGVMLAFNRLEIDTTAQPQTK